MVSATTVKRLVSATLLVALFYAGHATTSTAQDGGSAKQEQTMAERQNELVKSLYNAVASNWAILKVPPSQPVVRIRFNLGRDGSLIGEPVVETESDDPLFPDFAANAVRAVKKAAPFDLAGDGDLYDDWKTVIMTLDGRPFLGEGTQEGRSLPTFEEMASLWPETEPETDIDVYEKVKISGGEMHGLVIDKIMADGRVMTATALCDVDPAKGDFVFGIDFGLYLSWSGMQSVDVEIDGDRQNFTMHALSRNFFLKGDTAKLTIGKLLAASGTLKISGPQGASASFDLKHAGEQFARIKTLCAL